jgi:hypothetical protein
LNPCPCKAILNEAVEIKDIINNILLFLTIEWREAIRASEEKRKIFESQYGSQEEKSAQSSVLLEVLQHDVLILFRH